MDAKNRYRELALRALHRDCAQFTRFVDPAERNQVEFANRTDAVNAGYTPCGRCKP